MINKGIIEKYEPFYAKGLEFETPIDNQLNYKNGVQGEKIRMFYDPRGQLIRTINPNNSQRWVLFGKPYQNNITTPNSLQPTPWESYTYDANDLASITQDTLNEEETALTPASHHYTPSNSEIDPLGRTIQTVDRLSSINDADHADAVVMRYEYDIRGNLLKTTDALGRTAFEYSYDFSNRPLKVTHIDGGDKWTIYNAASQPIETRDSKGAITLYEYDQLNRPLKVWARDNENEAITLRQAYTYGEEAVRADGVALSDELKKKYNLIGKLYLQKHEGGLDVFDNYDFKGNLLFKTKQVFSDEYIINQLNTHDSNLTTATVNWETASFPHDLDPKEYELSSQYDALNRVTQLSLPKDLEGERKVFTTEYNRSGALESVQLDGTTYIDRIAYNARGQRILMALGNNTMTRYAYDDTTF